MLQGLTVGFERTLTAPMKLQRKGFYFIFNGENPILFLLTLAVSSVARLDTGSGTLPVQQS
jgi:hypothetical protein